MCLFKIRKLGTCYDPPGIYITSVGITGEPGRARPPSAIVGPLIGEKKTGARGAGQRAPPMGLLLSETRAIKAGTAQR